MNRGFSLVEVVLALGIVAFGIIMIVALLPMGVKLSNEAEQESLAVNVLSGMIADRGASSPTSNSVIYQISPLTLAATNSFGVSADGRIASGSNQADLRVSYVMHPPEPGNPGPSILWLRVAWPAQATNAPSSLETIAAFPLL